MDAERVDLDAWAAVVEGAKVRGLSVAMEWRTAEVLVAELRAAREENARLRKVLFSARQHKGLWDEANGQWGPHGSCVVCLAVAAYDQYIEGAR